jgi:acyl-CoA thioesterase FadM
MVRDGEPSGVWTDNHGTYHFNVERYFEYFEKACHDLYGDLMKQSNPTQPPELAGRTA